MSNITYKDIFLNGKGGPQAPGLRKRPGAVGGIHFKTGRGRGGVWEDISYVNIFGNFATNLVGFSENHGSGYDQALGPTNKTGTPQIRNLLVKDVVLTDVMGPPVIFTLAEVRVLSRSTSPQWGSIRVRLALRTYAPWGVRVVSLTNSKSKKTPTRKTSPLFFVDRRPSRTCRL